MYRFVIIILVIIAFVGLTVFEIGGALSRPALTSIGAPPADIAFKPVTIQTSKDQNIAGWFFQGIHGEGAILLLHGIRGSRLDMLGRARFLAKQGYSILLIDLPAHGESQAENITYGINESDGVKAAFAYLLRQLPNEKIGVIGVSLGAASFVFAASDVAPHAVVLESMYPTITEAVTDRLRLHLGNIAGLLSPLLLWQLPLRLGISPKDLRPIDGISSIHAPILIAAGSIDQHTTLAETKRLFDAANQPKELWIVEGAAHVNLHNFNPSAYKLKISAFFAKHLRGL
jgi:esterase/lipase